MSTEYEITACGDVLVRWPVIGALLGRIHAGTPDDDARMIRALLEAGAPDWVRRADGYVDEVGWYASRPEGEEEPEVRLGTIEGARETFALYGIHSASGWAGVARGSGGMEDALEGDGPWPTLAELVADAEAYYRDPVWCWEPDEGLEEALFAEQDKEAAQAAEEATR